VRSFHDGIEHWRGRLRLAVQFPERDLRQPLAGSLQSLGADVDGVVEFQVDHRNDGRVGNLLGDEPLRLPHGGPTGGIVPDPRVTNDPADLHEVEGQVGLAEVLAHGGNEGPEDLRVDLGSLPGGLSLALVPEQALDLAAGPADLVEQGAVEAATALPLFG